MHELMITEDFGSLFSEKKKENTNYTSVFT